MLLLLSTLTFQGAYASQNELSSKTEHFSLYYKQDRIVLEEDYLENKEQMAHIAYYLSHSQHIDSIVVYSFASPEGSFERNTWLSNKRGEVAKQYILSHLGPNTKLSPENIILRPVAEHWDGLYEEVKANYFRWDRDIILDIIKDDSIPYDTKKWRLEQLDHGVSYRYLILHHMQKLRMATWICVWETPKEKIPIADQKASVPMVDVKASYSAKLAGWPYAMTEPQYEKRTILALKTNLLYDAITALNAEVEVPIGNKFSLMTEDVFPWWTGGQNNKQYSFQMWEMGVEPRWWFYRTDKRDKLSGHFLAPYGMTAKYDIQNNNDFCYQGEYWSAGLAYGFSLPIGKVFNLEFEIAAGYMSTDYRHYQPNQSYSHLYRDRNQVGRLSYWGPTKAKVSLVLPITAKRRVK